MSAMSAAPTQPATAAPPAAPSPPSLVEVAFEPACLSERDGAERMLRWGLKDHLQVKRFKFSGRFQPDDAEQLVSSIVGSPEVLASLNVAVTSASAAAAGALSVAPVASTVLNMGFFDVLERENMMGSNGYLRKCMPETYDNVESDNLISDMMLNPDSENLSVYTQAQKAEFIYHLFKLLFVGGAMHQRDDYATEYLETTKALYKQLLTVHKSGRTGKIEISSQIFEVTKADDAGEFKLYNREHPHNKCCVVVDAVKKLATVVYLPFGGSTLF